MLFLYALLIPMKSNNKGLQRIVKATQYSWQGLRAAFKFEAAFRQEIFMLVVLTPFILWIDISSMEKAFLISTLFLLLIVELMNSALEAVVDRIGSEHHELSGRAKDIASSAVFVTFVMIGITWPLILWQPIIRLIL